MDNVIATAERLTINGVTYEVTASMTAEDMDAKGYGRVAAQMRAEGRNRELFLKRPKGRAVWMAIEFVTKWGIDYRLIPMGCR